MPFLLHIQYHLNFDTYTNHKLIDTGQITAYNSYKHKLQRLLYSTVDCGLSVTICPYRQLNITLDILKTFSVQNNEENVFFTSLNSIKATFPTKE